MTATTCPVCNTPVPLGTDQTYLPVTRKREDGSEYETGAMHNITFVQPHASPLLPAERCAGSLKIHSKEAG